MEFCLPVHDMHEDVHKQIIQTQCCLLHPQVIGSLAREQVLQSMQPASWALPVQDDDLLERGLLDLQRLEQVPEHGGRVRHDVAQRLPLHPLRRLQASGARIQPGPLHVLTTNDQQLPYHSLTAQRSYVPHHCLQPINIHPRMWKRLHANYTRLSSPDPNPETQGNITRQPVMLRMHDRTCAAACCSRGSSMFGTPLRPPTCWQPAASPGCCPSPAAARWSVWSTVAGGPCATE